MDKKYEREISPLKELFLSLCLVGREVSPMTIQMLKEDYGSSHISKCIIYTLIHGGIIEKTHYPKSYGYMLTAKGHEYIQRKFPDRYNYKLFGETRTTDKYIDRMRERNRSMSTVLYYLVKQGVSITDHHEIAEKIFNGEEAEISEAFFVTTKELRQINPAFTANIGTRAYGCMIDANNITVVYSPNAEHHLWLKSELEFKETFNNVLENAKPPYNNPKTLRVLYLYTSIPEIKNSFVVTAANNTGRKPQTKKCYKNLSYLQSYMGDLHNSVFQLDEISNEVFTNKIHDVFWDYFELTPYKRTIETMFVDGLYEGQVFTSILWDLNPTKIANAMEYALREGEKILFLCYEEQQEALEAILKINKILKKRIIIANLKKDDVIKYINGEIEEIE